MRRWIERLRKIQADKEQLLWQQIRTNWKTRWRIIWRYRNRDRASDLSQYTIAETPSIEITTLDKQEDEDEDGKVKSERWE